MRDHYLPGVPCWVDTAQPDPPAAARFYGGLFGWDFDDRMPAGSPGEYLVARLHGADVAAVASPSADATDPPVWTTYIAVEQADDAAAVIRKAGGRVLVEPFDVSDTGRMAVAADPSGAVFALWEAGSFHGAQLVNAPGTWNWSDLNTRDPASSAAFYGTVFGWEAATVDLGFGAGTMWRRPGYGNDLEADDPGLRRRHEEYGAPPGFADAVGWMLPMTPGQFPADVPPHWSVTFAVDDTDGTVARAAELGGSVVVPPFEAGPTRVAVLGDPAGAVFTVSHYQPQ
jgi:uncharacterized protein